MRSSNFARRISAGCPRKTRTHADNFSFVSFRVVRGKCGVLLAAGRGRFLAFGYSLRVMFRVENRLTPLRIPTGFRHSAQGCRSKAERGPATLGMFSQNSLNPE